MDKQYWANMALCVLLGGLAIFSAANISSALTPKGLLAFEQEPSAEAKKLLQDVKLIKFEAGEDTSHSVRAQFSVKNGSDQDVKNIKVQCEFFDSNGKYLDQESWIIGVTVPAGNAKMYSSVTKRFVHTKAKALDCKIKDLQVAEKSIFTIHRSASSGHGSVEEANGHGNSSH